MNSLRRVKLALWLVCGAAFPVVLVRLFYGLGAVTNLSDAIPWGLWKGLGVIAAIALAAGGFVLAGAIHAFHLRRYEALVRPAVLTAFCGYATAATSLLFDIGIPWRIWHPIIYWQHHSALFEVAWCVILYLNVVLVLEMAPIILERWPRWSPAVNLLRRFAAGVAILGVMISVLHQSTLGTIFLLTPHLVDKLWYSSLLPLLFITSAAATGMMVIVVEFILAARLYGRKLDLPMLAGVAKAAALTLAAYAVLRIVDVAARGALPAALHSPRLAALFFIEMIVGAIAPAALLAFRRVRFSPRGLLAAGLMVIFGFVVHRLTVCYLSMFDAAGRTYSPTWMEIALTAGLFAAAGLFFLFVVERFRVFGDAPAAAPEPPPSAENLSPRAWLDHPLFSIPARYSAAFLAAAAVSFFAIPFDAIARGGAQPTPTKKARGGHVRLIDGNRDGFGVSFPHERHVQKLGGPKSCVRCHHAHMPRDENTGCYECHADMYVSTSIFDHDLHAKLEGGNAGCVECHPAGAPRSKATAKTCAACHKPGELSLSPADSSIPVKDETACCYARAMHHLCIKCHREMGPSLGRPEHARCATCHPASKKPYVLSPQATSAVSANKWVLSPRCGSPAGER